jgi:hypothetical protein
LLIACPFSFFEQTMKKRARSLQAIWGEHVAAGANGLLTVRKKSDFTGYDDMGEES